MNSRKPQRGCCGVCGCAVVAPSDGLVVVSIAELISPRSWSRPGEIGWANGHQYDDQGRLVQVRCERHGGLGFPPEPHVHDGTYQMN